MYQHHAQKPNTPLLSIVKAFSQYIHIRSNVDLVECDCAYTQQQLAGAYKSPRICPTSLPRLKALDIIDHYRFRPSHITNYMGSDTS